MGYAYRMIGRFLRDERGAEVLEYALVGGMVTVGALAAISEVGAKVVKYWKALDKALEL